MKKIYQMPTIKWMKADTEEMMVASIIMPDMTVDLDNADETVATNGNLSRHNSIWGEEE